MEFCLFCILCIKHQSRVFRTVFWHLKMWEASILLSVDSPRGGSRGALNVMVVVFSMDPEPLLLPSII